MFLSIVLPAFNESQNLPRVLTELTKLLEAQPGVQKSEIVVVDDHSTDGTFGAVVNLGYSSVRVVRLSRRSGSHTALRAGLRLAQGDAVLCVAADGQDDPKVLAEMLVKHAQGAQVVWALRQSRQDEPFSVRVFATVFYKVLALLTGVKGGGIDLSRADFYLLDRKVVAALNECPETNTSLFGLIAWIGFRQDGVDYQRRERLSGGSKWNFRSRMRLAKDWIASFSGIPLKAITLIGFAVSTLGFVYALTVFINFIFGQPVEGWSSIMLAILFTSGIQMIMLGVIGEYLWRTLDEARKRPIYFIEDSAGRSDAQRERDPVSVSKVGM